MGPREKTESGHRRGADALFPGGGRVMRRCRAWDWGATRLGPVESWPQSLRTAAGMVAVQSRAQSLCWGPDLLQIYNDAFEAVLGADDPPPLGSPILSGWPAIRDPLTPLVERSLAGESAGADDVPVRIQREGISQPVRLTFCCIPVPAEGGEVGGVLIDVTDTTEQVLARPLQAERDRLLGQLDTERARLAYVFRHAPGFFAVLRGPDHAFELVNDAFRRLVGSRAVEERPLAEAVPELVEQRVVDLFDRVRERGEPWVGHEVSVRLAPSSDAPPEERFLDLSCVPMMEADGASSGIIVHGTDVTDGVRARRQVERLLSESEAARSDAESARAEAEEARAEAEESRAEAEEARTEAEGANQAKTDFLASMSHDLRTPLNSLSGYIDLLDAEIQGPLNDDQRKAVGHCRSSLRHLIGLIEDVLAFATLEAGRIEMDVRDLPARDLLHSVEPLVRPVAGKKNIDLTFEEPPASVKVRADAERARQILVNLIGNAIKFTGAGGRVSVSCEEDGEWVAIQVRDSGVGIAAQRQAAIFDPFVQEGRRLGKPGEGAGLGLSISRDLARGMGGELEVTSTPGEGSTFTLRLPVSAPQEGGA